MQNSACTRSDEPLLQCASLLRGAFGLGEVTCGCVSSSPAARATCLRDATDQHASNGADASLSRLPSSDAPDRVSGEVATLSNNDAEPLFRGFFLGGFECSCQKLQSGRRLDLLRSTRHDEFADVDYQRMRAIGMTACREGVSWVDAARDGLDFSSVSSRIRAARRHGVEVLWDLMHFGWPDDVDLFSPAFIAQFGRYARAFAHFYACESDRPLTVAPINEISFLSWAGGDVRCMNPFLSARGDEMKVQLVRATIEAIEAIRDEVPAARFLQPEPVINIVPSEEHPKTWRRVECDNLLQYETWDMLCGRTWQSLGGHPRYLDIVGLNFYSDNQFMLDGTTIARDDSRYRPFSEMLLEVWRRYQRPMIVSETGHEGEARAPWLRYVSDESVAAMGQGCELHGITLYPVLNTLGWEDDRDCLNGLWGHANDAGERLVDAPLAQEIWRQTARLTAARTSVLSAQRATALSV